MKIAVLGTGMVGRTIAARLFGLGHEVVVGTRDPQATLGPHRARRHGQPVLRGLGGGPAQGCPSPPSPTRRPRPSSSSTPRAGTARCRPSRRAGADNLAGKIVLDISNPLDFSNGFPPTLFVKDTDSLGEQVQRAFPQARVVKTLNTLTAELMVHPKNLGQESSVFVSGNDAEAKAIVTELLESFGHTDVIDLGDISTARGTEMLLPVWLRLMGAFGTAAFNFKIVR